jgi:putative transposase
VKAITEELCGHSFSASNISRINQTLDDELKKFATRHLDEEYTLWSAKTSSEPNNCSCI